MRASVALISTAVALLLVASCAPQESAVVTATPSEFVWLGGPVYACQARVGADGQVGC